MTYRLNNKFDSIESYSYDSHGKKCITGKFYIPFDFEIENKYKDIKYLINLDDISNVGKIYNLINENKIYMSHFCQKNSDKRIYNSARMLGAMIAFERLFNWQYDKRKIRNEDYIELLNRINKLLVDNKIQICEGLNSEQRGNFKYIVDHLNEAQIDFGGLIRTVVKKIDLCKYFIERIYCKEYNRKLLDEICKRANKFRNNMAHGNINIDFISDNTKDIKLLEIIFYL